MLLIERILNDSVQSVAEYGTVEWVFHPPATDWTNHKLINSITNWCRKGSIGQDPACHWQCHRGQWGLMTVNKVEWWVLRQNDSGNRCHATYLSGTERFLTEPMTDDVTQLWIMYPLAMESCVGVKPKRFHSDLKKLIEYIWPMIENITVVWVMHPNKTAR